MGKTKGFINKINKKQKNKTIKFKQNYSKF